MSRSRDRRYSTVAITFHWVIAALVIFNLVIGLLHESVPPLKALMPAHMAVGITVLVLTAGRVAWRLSHRPPALPATVPAWQRRTAHATHWALYALLVALPLTGWAMVSGHGHPVSWFGLFAVPSLPVSHATGGSAHDAHEVLGWLMAALVAIHVAAALRHHFILRDRVLDRMAPAAR